MVFLRHWQLRPADLDDLTGIQVRQLADQTDRIIEAERKAAAETERQRNG